MMMCFDFEFVIDQPARARLIDIERFDGNSKDNAMRHVAQPRAPLRRLAAVSFMTFGLDEDRNTLPVELDSASLADMNEADLVVYALERLRSHAAPSVGYNSRSWDIRTLVYRAMVHRIAVPPKVSAMLKPIPGWAPDHIDLMEDLCGRGERFHLTEFAAALGIPAKTVMAPRGGLDLGSPVCFDTLRQVAECDVVTTALLWCGWTMAVEPSARADLIQAKMLRWVSEESTARPHLVAFSGVRSAHDLMLERLANAEPLESFARVG